MNGTLKKYSPLPAIRKPDDIPGAVLGCQGGNVIAITFQVFARKCEEAGVDARCRSCLEAGGQRQEETTTRS